jgi:hypothetical protein
MSLASVNLTSALGPDGLFAVRADTEAKPVVAFSNRYGAEPSTGNWPIASVGEVLFYGVKVTPSASFDDPPVASASVFDLKTIPSGLTFSPEIRVGVCDLPDVTSSDNARILHVHGSAATVLKQDPPSFCTAPFTSLEAPSSMFAFAAHRVASWFAPKPAFAASRAMMPTGFKTGGGTVGGLSEIGAIQFQDTLTMTRVPNAAVSDTALSYDSDPLSNQFGSGGLAVTAQTKVGHNALAGVVIKLTIVNNKGSYVPSPFDTATTDETGVARFPRFFVDKAGGYTVVATTLDFGNVGAWTTNVFNISGK